VGGKPAEDHLESPENLQALRNTPDTSGIQILQERYEDLDIRDLGPFRDIQQRRSSKSAVLRPDSLIWQCANQLCHITKN
jgi:hypothetical protein